MQTAIGSIESLVWSTVMISVDVTVWPSFDQVINGEGTPSTSHSRIAFFPTCTNPSRRGDVKIGVPAKRHLAII
jgi:hypothetical protein